MSCDAYVEWIENQDSEELTKKFLEKKGLTEEYESWLFERWQEEESDKNDYLYEMEKDRRLGI